ncbi:carboxymuconolactone decarboxylase family protein [Candidatus Saccharibacteria bacterium]|nr:carboxymuconolactone decarboxylase family protein [Candidatus Saccharibacteria bacterium]
MTKKILFRSTKLRHSLRRIFNIKISKEHGLTKEELVETVTQLAFYCGWPKAWSTFPIIEKVYEEE